ncbi:uncharacterized protein LTR77_006958 [Saxophila tyrrhenica]|uniref:CASP-like protein n=1 Tax=Saxophila tyrrhenica TaxID=1690608 RepID=A0AAV9P960_9PEZI|nr:hypothetical protein LTR77_006958 [Saxophila tyrrhenica]
MDRQTKLLLLARASQIVFTIATMCLLGACANLKRWTHPSDGSFSTAWKPYGMVMCSGLYNSAFSMLFGLLGIVAATRPDKLAWQIMIALDCGGVALSVGALVCAIKGAIGFGWHSASLWYATIAFASFAAVATGFSALVMAYVHMHVSVSSKKHSWLAETPREVEQEPYHDDQPVLSEVRRVSPVHGS